MISKSDAIYPPKEETARWELDASGGLLTVLLQILIGLLLVFLFPACQFGTGKTAMSPQALSAYTRALELYNQGRYSEAADSSVSLSAYYPAQLLRGKALFFASRYAEAERILAKVQKLRPSSAEAKLYRAYCARSLGKDAEARMLAEELLADDSANLRAYRLLLDLTEPGRERSKMLDQALEAAGEAALIFTERARSRWILGDAPGALSDLNAAKVLLNPESLLYGPLATLEKTILFTAGGRK